MDQQTGRKRCKDQLKPTAEPERALDGPRRRCRPVCIAALGERREAWQQCGVSVGDYQPNAERPPIKAERPQDTHMRSPARSPVLQGVAQRVDRVF
jgi:hypothetical protein